MCRQLQVCRRLGEEERQDTSTPIAGGEVWSVGYYDLMITNVSQFITVWYQKHKQIYINFSVTK